MARIQVLAGDFLYGQAVYNSGCINIETALYPWPGINVSVSDLKTLEIDHDASGHSLPSALGVGMAGALMLGPMGAAGGLMFSEDTKEVSFWAELKDGRKFAGVTDAETYLSIEKAATHVAASNASKF
jgi:hypothetical protein